jgi:ABC-type cobalamin/Fe3+-siderophores transport system ATPase subunit
VKLAADDLVLSYGATPIVDHVSLHIPEGKVSAFLGPNGSGKSTIFRALARLLRPRHGTVVIDGTAIGSMTTKQVARKLAILPQQPVTPESITVEDLVWYGRHPHRKPLVASGAADREAVEWAIRATQLEGLRAHPVDALSGGQRQRAWIALALAQDTSILLLDEPTTFLDLSHQLEVLELCAELNREQGKTVVMVLHDVNLAAEYCDHLFVIKNGQVFTQGSPEEVLTCELIRDVFDVDTQVIPHPVSGRPLCIPSAKKTAVANQAVVTTVSMIY